MMSDPLDTLARSLATMGSRRRLLGALAGAPLLGGLFAVLSLDEADAKKKRRKKRRKKKQK
jgi:hypothetical protein